MLTKSDLQQISLLLDKKFNQKFGVELDEKLDKKFSTELKPLKVALLKIQKDLKTIVNYFDEEYLNHDHRIRKIETHLGFHPTI